MAIVRIESNRAPSNGDPNPGLALDYDRYQSFANASFSNKQLAVLRKNCPRHFVTTNNVGAPADTLNLHELYKDLENRMKKAVEATQAGKGSLFGFWADGAPEFLKFINA